MSKSPQRPALLMLLTAVLALSACGDKSRKVAPESQEASEPAVEEVASNEPQLPAADYFAPVLASAAGSYSACQAIGAGAEGGSKASGTVVVAANGKVSGADVAADVTPDTDSMMIRQRAGNAAPTVSLAVQSDKFTLSLMEHDDGTKQAHFGSPPNNLVQCKITTPIKLASQSLYATYAYVMDAKTRIKCLNADTFKFDEVDYQVAKGVLKIADEVYDLNTLKMETVSFGKDKLFSYLGQTADERSIMVFLDAQGKVKNLQVRGKGNKAYACDVSP
ncbi:hypothetical protein IV454_20580 [Massilia antarctica]|uniref:Uncharacterized protein n=1 Tax=Massilia antarctica TaxID=2765360 RepID=A0AA48W7Z9_9BURK|nr:hypothetical protein [Massilia antarctica]QPI47955.1 hypothetical protein IV454_20580 [Massilia antarctica]